MGLVSQRILQNILHAEIHYNIFCPCFTDLRPTKLARKRDLANAARKLKIACDMGVQSCKYLSKTYYCQIEKVAMATDYIIRELDFIKNKISMYAESREAKLSNWLPERKEERYRNDQLYYY